jgi:adenylate cyclase
MTIFKTLHFWLSLVILIVALVFFIAEPPWVVILRNFSFDYFQRLKPRVYEPAPVRIIDIDEESLKKFGQWPWPRTVLADLVENLGQMGAAAIVFDMVFAEPDRTSPAAVSRYWPNTPDIVKLVKTLPDHDQVFAQTISKWNVTIGFSASSSSLGGELPQQKARFIFAGDDPKQFLLPFEDAVKNLYSIENAASGNGAFNFIADYDGIIRHVPLVVRIKDTLYPALSTEVLRTAQGTQNIVVKSSGASGEQRAGEHTGIIKLRVGGVEASTDAQGEIWLYYSHHVPERYIPAWTVLNAQINPSYLADHIVFIGSSAKGLLDLRVNPLRSIIPGVEVHAQLVEQLIQNSYILFPDWSKAAVVLCLLFIWIVLIAVTSRVHVFWLSILGIISITAVCVASWYMFIQHRLFFDPLYPSLTLTALFVSTGFSRYIVSEREKRWIGRAFSSYVSPNLVQHLIKNPQQLELGGEIRECSFVLTDLAGFTSFMEKSEPGAVVELLNIYLDEMLTIAFHFDATLDRIVGDAIAVMFSAPVTQPDHAVRAVQCALAMDSFAQQFSQEKQKQGIPLGITRIGVHTGHVLVGNFGGKTMFDYRALGDPINTASRLETVNKHLGTRICVSAATVAQYPEFIGRPVGTLFLKGKTKGIEAYEPLTEEEFHSPRVKAYMHAFELLKKQKHEAQQAFKDLVHDFPQDPLAHFHLKRLIEKGENGIDIVMKEK